MNAAGGPGNPYVGPKPFTIGQRLYGRDWETRMLNNLLLSKRLVLLHSPSGAGKTSLIQAGLWTRLEDTFRTRPLIRVNAIPDPTGAPPNRYVYSTIRSLDPDGEWDVPPGRLSDLPFEGEEAKPELWIFDQFEEVLSLDPLDDAEKHLFFEQLAEALQSSDEPRWALFAMRDDYLGAMEPYLKVLPTGLSTRFRLELLDTDAARQAIQEPARVAGVDFTDAAAQKLIDDLRRIRVRGPDDSIDERLGPHVEPLQLQLVCHRHWDHREPAATAILPNDVEDVGDVDTALSGYYAEHVAAVTAKTGVSERTIREWFDRRLITADRIRGQVMGGKDQGLASSVIKPLVEAYLIREERRRGEIFYELAHDRLIDPIRQNNAAWREQELEPFQRQAAQWHAEGRPPELLLLEADLKRAERWELEHPDELSIEEEQFLDKSRQIFQKAEKERVRQAELRTNLADIGWGVIFAHDADLAVREALRELLEHRRGQAAQKRESRYREFSGDFGYLPKESAEQFLSRHKAGMSLTDPDRMPYYLLIVGDPESIPYEFQYQLSVQYAVGRIHFPTLDEYAAYARSIVMAERGQHTVPRQAVIFSPSHPFDQASGLSTRYLSLPMAARLDQSQPDWAVESVVQQEATKASLAQLLGGEATPAVLFTFSHSLAFPNGDERQLPLQGSLVCQDWPGFGPLNPEQYFSAEDVGGDARLLGLIAFLSTSYSAGTPRDDDLISAGSRQRQQIAPHAFMARLPERLLGHPNGGALAVIGHVDRLWFSSFMREDRTADITLFENTLRSLMKGYTVGASIEFFNRYYVQLSATLAAELAELVFIDRSDEEYQAGRDLAERNVATAQDARNYVIIGDPAARLPVGDRGVVAERARIVQTPSLPASDSGPLIFNGINGATGEYLLPPMTAEQIAAVARGVPLAADIMRDLRWRLSIDQFL
jgi:hypothetical protein